uniref:hypothetical protein n=1 Tax=Staphylococcus epidermidis TaxID=1282 RepID=UPI001642E2ED
RLPVSTYRCENGGGGGIEGMKRLDEELVSELVRMSRDDDVVLFRNKGGVYKVKGYEVGEL